MSSSEDAGASTALSDLPNLRVSAPGTKLLAVSSDPLYVIEEMRALPSTPRDKRDSLLFDDALFQRHFQTHFVDKNVAPIAFLGFDQQTHPVLICIASNNPICNSIADSFPEVASPELSSEIPRGRASTISGSSPLSSPSLSGKDTPRFHRPIPILIRSCHFRPLTVCDQFTNLFVPPKTLSSRKALKSLLRMTFPELLEGSRLFPLPESNPSLVPDILRLEEKLIISGAKFGFLYCAPGQTTEDEMLSNQVASPQFEEFLSILGRKVDLATHTGYRGDLDITGANTAGEWSYISSHRGIEMMFHVNTLLPHTENDPQQVSKKKYIGNDVVVVIFQDSITDGHLIDPATFRSQFNHVFIAVAPVVIDGIPHYRVECSHKVGVLPHPPELLDPPLFPVVSAAGKGQFRDWFLTKLINSTRAALHAAGFRGSLIRTRRQLFNEMITARYYDGPKPKTWKLTPVHSSPKVSHSSKLRESNSSPRSEGETISSCEPASSSAPSTPKSSFLSRVRSFDSDKFSSVKKGFSLSSKKKPLKNIHSSSNSDLTEISCSPSREEPDDPDASSPSGSSSRRHPRINALADSPAPSPRARSSTLGTASPPTFKRLVLPAILD